MAAVLAVVVLLLCGNVQSEQDFTATVTQVISTEDTSPPTTNGSDSAVAMAPAIASPTEGSGVTRSAVLSSQTYEQGDSVLPVDLARKDEELSNVNSEPAPAPPSDEYVPEGFDLNEEETESAEPGSGSPDAVLAKDEAGGGSLVENMPTIGGNRDYSNGPDYGVTNGGSSETPGYESESFSSYGAGEGSDDPSFAQEDQGTLVGDMPTIGGNRDYSNGPDYGVTNGGSSETPGYESESFSSYGAGEGSDDPSFAQEDQGTLVGDMPPIGGNRDYSNGPDYGVTNGGSSETPGYESESFSSHSQDEYSGEYESDSLYDEPPQGGFLTPMEPIDLNP